MPFVLDSSVALSWVLPDESHMGAEALKLRLAADHALVPAIWPYEIANILSMSVKTGRLPRKLIDASLSQLRIMAIEVDAYPAELTMEAILQLSEKLRLSAYDAAYIDCATRNELPFATLDKKLRAAAIKAGIEVLL